MAIRQKFQQSHLFSCSGLVGHEPRCKRNPRHSIYDYPISSGKSSDLARFCRHWLYFRTNSRIRGSKYATVVAMLASCLYSSSGI